MIGVLLWVLAGLAGLVLAVLVLPVRLRIVAATVPAPRLRLRLSLLGGLFPAIPLVDSARAPGPDRPAPPRRRRKRRRSGARRGPALRRLRGVPDLARAILGAFRIRRLRLDADFGLGDPAETGIAYGLLAPLVHAGAVTLRPDFSGPRLSGSVDAEIGLVPARLLPPLLRFAWRNIGTGRP
jgi:hypothetical protein